MRTKEEILLAAELLRKACDSNHAKADTSRILVRDSKLSTRDALLWAAGEETAFGEMIKLMKSYLDAIHAAREKPPHPYPSDPHSN